MTAVGMTRKNEIKAAFLIIRGKLGAVGKQDGKRAVGAGFLSVLHLFCPCGVDRAVVVIGRFVVALGVIHTCDENGISRGGKDLSRAF